MKENQGHWYVVRMPLYEVRNINRLTEINGKTFQNRMEVGCMCDDLCIKNIFGMHPTLDFERLDSYNEPSKGSITFPGGHAEIRVFLSLE